MRGLPSQARRTARPTTRRPEPARCRRGARSPRPAAGHLLRLLPRRVRRRRPSAAAVRCPSHRPAARGRDPRAGRERTAHLTDEDLRVLELRRLPRRARARLRRAPRRPAAGVQGDRRGPLRSGTGDVCVRHRDARTRRQHAGSHGGHREADEVERRDARRRSRRRSTPSSPAAPDVAASTSRATPSCCGSRASTRRPWPGWPPPAPIRCARRSARPTTWRSTWCARWVATPRERCSRHRSRSSRPTGPSSAWPGSCGRTRRRWPATPSR